MKLRRAPRRRGEPRYANVTRELVERRASEVARRAFAFVDETDVIQRLSLVDLGHLAAGWAAALHEQGAEPGDRVVVLANGQPEWLGAILGALKLGAIGVPCPPSLLPGELAEITRIAQAGTIVASQDAQKIVATTEAAPPAIWLEDVEPATSRAAASIATYDTAMDDVALLLPVRGPDGSARLAAHTHDSCLRGASRGRHWLGSGRRDRLWCTAEVGTPEFVTTVLGAWAQGTEVVLHEPLDGPVKRLEALELLRVTILVQSAGEYRALASYRGRVIHDLSGVREAISLGEPASAAAHATFRDRYDIWIRTCYGRPESGVVAADPRGEAAHTGSVGVPLPGSRVGVIDENGSEVEPGEAGDLAVGEGAPGLFAGYWDDRDATESVFRSNWFLTGDRAVREPGDVVRLAFPAEVRALDDRRRTAADARQKAAAEELRRQKELEAQEARLRDEEEARREDERRRRDAERQTKAEERTQRDEARAEERRRLEEEKRQVVELKVAAERRRQTEQAARRLQERDVRQAEKEAKDRARAADRVVAEARTREEQEQKRQQTLDRERGRAASAQETAKGNESRRAEEAERRQAEQERKRLEALEREQERTRAEAEKRAREEARRAEEAERRRVEEERKRQAAVEREQERTRAEAEKRAREEARSAEETERRRAEEERKRQRELERREKALAREQKTKRSQKTGGSSGDGPEEPSIVSRIGAYGVTPKDRRRPPGDGGPDKAA